MKNISYKINWNYLTTAIVLLIFGFTALYSASSVESFKRFGETTYFIKKQLFPGLVMGIIAFVVCYKLNYHVWEKYLSVLIFGTLGLLLATKLSSFGFGSGGADRWLNFGFVTFQPAEIAKLVIIFYLAAWLSKRKNQLHDFTFNLLPSFVIIGLFAGLILWQPDFGTMSVLIGVSFFMLFSGGLPWKYFFWTLVCGALSLYLVVHFEPYRMRRLTAFLDPGADPKGISYHINQALLAIGSGGLFGYGYGLSRQKHSYLPEVMGDSIFAVTAEELGFVRILLIFALFIALLIFGLKISQHAKDDFGKYTAYGISVWFTLQAIINISAMIKLIPLTGIPLPFFSIGSTALVMNLAAIGIMMSIHSESKT